MAAVKKAYQMLRADQPIPGQREFWKRVWGQKELLPKLKLFIWKCVSNAVPVQVNIARRILMVSALCQLCMKEEESVVHALFHCQFARAAWLAFPLGIRSDMLTGDFGEIIESVRETIGEQVFLQLMAIVWAVWRCRNGAMYGNKKMSITACQEFWNRAMEDSNILSAGLTVHGGRLQGPQDQVGHNQSKGDRKGFNCYVDGSWDDTGSAGIGLIIVKRGLIVSRESFSAQAVCAAQAEAKAICKGLQTVASQSWEGGNVYSDSLELVNALAQPLPNVLDWRVSRELWDAWRIKFRLAERIKLVFTNRESQFIKAAHDLANQGRNVECNKRRAFSLSLVESSQQM